jgi:hypothetical protein
MTPLRWGGIYGALLLLSGAVSLALAQETPKNRGAAAAGVAAKLRVVLSTEQNGYITPCGCSKPMLGGMPRRATYIQSLPTPETLLKVDNGDLTPALGRQDELKAETMVEMLNHLGYDAVNVGEKDFQLGVPYLQSLQARFRGTFLSANVRRAGGEEFLKPFAVVTRDLDGQSVKVIVVGVLARSLADTVRLLNPDLQVEPPDAALERLEPEIRARAERRILLFHGPKAEAEEIARRFPMFQLVVYAHEGDHPVDAVRVGNTTLACNGQDGKYVGLATFAAGGGAGAPAAVADVTYTALSPVFADDPRLQKIKGDYLDRVTAEDLLGKVVRRPTLNGDTFAGSAACASCHGDAHRVWKDTKHAVALRTLAEDKEDKDPECVTCHVVGMDRIGGFRSAKETPHLQDVGCESCHGAAAKHAADPTGAPMPKSGVASCLQCHVPQHSPKFDFAAYWEKIKH